MDETKGSYLRVPSALEMEIKQWAALLASSQLDTAFWKRVATEWAKRALRAESQLARFEGPIGEDGTSSRPGSGTA